MLFLIPLVIVIGFVIYLVVDNKKKGKGIGPKELMESFKEKMNHLMIKMKLKKAPEAPAA
jgi:hypothetical protein